MQLTLTQEVQGMDEYHDDVILTIDEAAKMLQIGKRSMYKIVKENPQIGRKLLNKFRFSRNRIFDFIRGTG